MTALIQTQILIFDDDCKSITSTISSNDKERKYQTANSGEITTNVYEDLDSKVETFNYEDDAQKIRELEQKIALMEKYIRKLEISVHLLKMLFSAIKKLYREKRTKSKNI